VLMDAPAYPGSVVPSRLIGVIEAEQTEDRHTERNDRLLAVASHSVIHRSIRDVHDLNADLVKQIEHFFVSYHAAKGKIFQPKGRFGRSRAHAIVARGIKHAKR